MKSSHLAGLVLLLIALLTTGTIAETLRAIVSYEGKAAKEISLKNEWALWEPLRDFLTSPQDGTMRVALIRREWLLEKKGDKIRMTEGEQVNEGQTADLLAEFKEIYSSTPLEVCKANLLNTKYACTMWFIDHDDLYPTALSALVPDYFLRPVYCPISTGAHYNYERASDGKSFQVRCLSDHGTEPKPSVSSDAETEAKIRELKPD